MTALYYTDSLPNRRIDDFGALWRALAHFGALWRAFAHFGARWRTLAGDLNEKPPPPETSANQRKPAQTSGNQRRPAGVKADVLNNAKEGYIGTLTIVSPTEASCIKYALQISLRHAFTCNVFRCHCFQ